MFILSSLLIILNKFMSDTVERFSNRVENYVKYRPHYPPEILELFRDEMNLEKNSVIADIGSGTGISAKLFLENGNRFTASSRMR